jgi:predicted HAD superfamily Cof-like phosphohydrolase
MSSSPEVFNKNIEEQIEPLTQFEMVKLFTKESGFVNLRKEPSSFSKDDLYMLSKMITDETMELLSTTMSIEEAKLVLINNIINNNYTKKPPEYKDEREKIADQADALVDIQYYMMNAAAKNNINLDPVFKEVHAANMRKRDPTTGKFNKRPEDGKILKPSNWVPPDIKSVINNQFNDS